MCVTSQADCVPFNRERLYDRIFGSVKQYGCEFGNNRHGHHYHHKNMGEIIKGKRRITADTALRLSSYFGNSAKFWLGLQNDYDIEEENKLNEQTFKKIQSLSWSSDSRSISA